MSASPGNRIVWHYQSFMLRLWREAPGAPYRASLQATTNGEQVAFADLSMLFAFLAQIEAQPHSSHLDIPNAEQDE